MTLSVKADTGAGAGTAGPNDKHALARLGETSVILSWAGITLDSKTLSQAGVILESKIQPRTGTTVHRE
jgi:hypothetical protein